MVPRTLLKLMPYWHPNPQSLLPEPQPVPTGKDHKATSNTSTPLDTNSRLIPSSKILTFQDFY